MKNNIKKDIINNIQQNYLRVNYCDYDIFSYMDIGKKRSKQEDSTLFMRHPFNKNFILLAIADGMGGLGCGNIASNITMHEIIKWFDKIPLSYYNSEINLLNSLKDKIFEIDEIIRNKCYGGGTTLSIVLITKKNTFCTNIGDSRIYIENDKKIYQISNDHSISWSLYMNGVILNKDDIRFHKKNHLITSRIGGVKKMISIEENNLKNEEYSGIYLFSDGVTDCISDNMIDNIIKESTKEQCAKNLVNYAINMNSYQNYLNMNDYYEIIEAGKDNASCTVYSKK